MCAGSAKVVDLSIMTPQHFVPYEEMKLAAAGNDAGVFLPVLILGWV